MESPSKIIAASIALTGFTAAIVAGLGAGNSAHSTIVRGLFCMVGCLAVGRAVGWASTTALKEMLEQFRDRHPIDDVETEAAKTSAAKPAGGPA